MDTKAAFVLCQECSNFFFIGSILLTTQKTISEVWAFSFKQIYLYCSKITKSDIGFQSLMELSEFSHHNKRSTTARAASWQAS